MDCPYCHHEATLPPQKVYVSLRDPETGAPIGSYMALSTTLYGKIVEAFNNQKGIDNE